jgi:hypothetical protein
MVVLPESGRRLDVVIVTLALPTSDAMISNRKMLIHAFSDVMRFSILQAGGDRTRQPFFGPGGSRII